MAFKLANLYPSSATNRYNLQGSSCFRYFPNQHCVCRHLDHLLGSTSASWVLICYFNVSSIRLSWITIEKTKWEQTAKEPKWNHYNYSRNDGPRSCHANYDNSGSSMKFPKISENKKQRRNKKRWSENILFCKVYISSI